MKVAELIALRQTNWEELEWLSKKFGGSNMSADEVHRFSTLYRSACADLALAESYQLPPNTVEYLHRLVAKAHNQLYRSRGFRMRHWLDIIFQKTPRLIFHEPCVHIATMIFWGLFILSVALAYDEGKWPGFTEQVVGETTMEQMRLIHGSSDIGSQASSPISLNTYSFGFYVFHNGSIGLNCFISMLGVLPGLVTLSFNSTLLGAIFGFMFRPELGETGQNFQRFVTAHGPFELTAIVLSAGAGLKIGISWIWTGGLARGHSLLKTAREALPIAMTALILFCMAAVIEGFISPQPDIPWAFKGVIAVGSNFLLLFYLVILGFPEPEEDDKG